MIINQPLPRVLNGFTPETMKFFIPLHVLTVFGLLALTGCQTVDSVIGGEELHYNCVEGSTLAGRLGQGRKHLDVTYTYSGQVIYRGVLQSMATDFGERFRAEDGTSFWINEQKGLLNRPGEEPILCHKAI